MAKDTKNRFLAYKDCYENYFKNNNKRFGNTKIQLDPLPRLILIPKIGLMGIGKNKKSAKIASDIGEAWIETLLSAESVGKFPCQLKRYLRFGILEFRASKIK